MPGNFNYTSAAALLNALFVNPKSAGSGVANMRIYTSTGNANWTTGNYNANFSYGSGSTTAGNAVQLYIGLILATSGNPPASADSFFNATGTAFAAGYGEPYSGSSATHYGYTAYRRQAISFVGTADSGSSPALPQATSSGTQVTFPALDSSGITSGLVAVGFFITTEQPGVTNGSGTATLPSGFPAAGTIVAAGTFTSSRALAANDQPIFVGNAITISLD